jgi:hypothetical protein
MAEQSISVKRLEVGQCEEVASLTHTTNRRPQRLANKVKAGLLKHQFPGMPASFAGRLAETRTSLDRMIQFASLYETPDEDTLQ